MALKVNLGTMANIGVVEGFEQRVAHPLVIRSGSLRVNLRMPRPGRNVVRILDIPQIASQSRGVVEFSTMGGISQFSFDAEVKMPGGPVKFGYKNIGIHDTVSIMQVDTDRFFVNVFHAQRTIGCRAVCPDGSEGQPCVDCRVNGVTFRICC